MACTTILVEKLLFQVGRLTQTGARQAWKSAMSKS